MAKTFDDMILVLTQELEKQFNIKTIARIPTVNKVGGAIVEYTYGDEGDTDWYIITNKGMPEGYAEITHVFFSDQYMGLKISWLDENILRYVMEFIDAEHPRLK